MVKLSAVPQTHSLLGENFDAAESAFLFRCEVLNLSDATTEWYGWHLKIFRRFLATHYPTVTPTLITTHVVSDFIAERRGRVTADSINGTLRTLKVFSKWLADEGHIEADPLAKFPYVKTAQRIPHTLSQEQVAALLGQPNRKTFTGLRDFTLMLLLLDTGLRISEAFNLTLDDVDWPIGLLTVRQGKGRKDRQVPFGTTVRQALGRYLERRGHLEGNTLVFVTCYGDPQKPNVIQHAFRRYAKKAGLTGVRVSPHSLRHTFARTWIVNGGDAFTLQRMLGHTTLTMTRRYVDLFTDDLTKAHARFSPVDGMKKVPRVRQRIR